MDRRLHFANANAKVFRFPHIRGSPLNEAINRRVFSFCDAFFPSALHFTCERYVLAPETIPIRKFWETKRLNHSSSFRLRR